MTTIRPVTGSRDDVLVRLARIEGQVRGIARMVEQDKYCIDVLTQIAASTGPCSAWRWPCWRAT